MTPAGLMRTLLPSRLLRPTSNAVLNLTFATSPSTTIPATTRCNPRACLRNCRCFAHVHDDKLNRDIWFTSTPPRSIPPTNPSSPQHQQEDQQRSLQLSKSVRLLHERLPTLLQSPLPSDILSPQISLHLFPSTHPHLPTVSGRIAYIAALWTAPVVWGRVPVVGNVRLTILSERMVRNAGWEEGRTGGEGEGKEKWREEKLVVKWKTCGKTHHRDTTGGTYPNTAIGSRDPVDKIRSFISGPSTTPTVGGDQQEFTGLFIFSFDTHGRIIKHIIEHTEENSNWEDRMTRVVSVTDWLLGQIKGGKGGQRVEGGLAWCEEGERGDVRIVERGRREEG